MSNRIITISRQFGSGSLRKGRSVHPPGVRYCQR